MNGRDIRTDHRPGKLLRRVFTTRGLRVGRHRLAAVAFYSDGVVRVAHKIVRMRAPAPPPPSRPRPPTSETPHATSRIAWFDFDGGTLLGWSPQRLAEDRISVVDSPQRAGGKSARFEIRGSETRSGEARAELALNGYKGSEGQEPTYSWSTFVSPDFPNVDSGSRSCSGTARMTACLRSRSWSGATRSG